MPGLMDLFTQKVDPNFLWQDVKVDPKMAEQAAMAAMFAAPAGITLMHGGPSAITSVDPARLMQSVHSTGLHTTNKVFTPQSFATQGGKRSGVISVFDFPDELYAKTLRMNQSPMSKRAEEYGLMQSLAGGDDAVAGMLRSRLKDQYMAARAQGQSPNVEDLITGEMLNNIMRKTKGGLAEGDQALAAAGFPGKTWQYSHERPAELATAIFPEFVSELRPIGQYDTAPGLMKLVTEKIKEDLARKGF